MPVIDDDEPVAEVPLVPADVPVPVPLVVPAVEPIEPLELDELAGCALVSSQLPDADEVVPLVAVPVVPVVLAPAGCRQPTTRTVLAVLLVVGDVWLELVVCAYAATAAPITSASDAPQMFRFMRASFAPRELQCGRRSARA